MDAKTEEFKTVFAFVDKQIPKRIRDEICAKLGKSSASLYRMKKKINVLPVASSLKPKKRGPKQGRKNFEIVTENLMQEAIQTYYLSKQKPKISKTYLRLIERFDRAGIEPPSESTFRRRIKEIAKSDEAKGRMYASEIKSILSPKTQHFVSSAPMTLVQIDHTKLNAILISQIDGKPLGRVTITIVTDIYTGMVLGFFLSLYGPDHECVSNALAHAFYDKTEYLKRIGIIGEWPNLGLPDKLLMDNAKEFKSKALIHGCGEYGINRQYRPIRTPHYGGHVESLIKTINENIRNIPGATFANIQERGDYPSEKLACFTLPMIEKHIANFIVNYYHKKEHSRLGISPNQKYQYALGHGFRPRLSPKSKCHFIADFSETHMRSLRDIGIEFESKEYWSPYLASLHNQHITEVRILPVSNTVRSIEVLGPDDKLYTVPAKNSQLPDITRREWKRYHKIVRERNNANKMTNAEIAHYIRQENKIEREAKQQSKRLRRAAESQLEVTNLNHSSHNQVTTRLTKGSITFDPKSAFKTSSDRSPNV